jgi:hypothetical protein
MERSGAAAFAAGPEKTLADVKLTAAAPGIRVKNSRRLEVFPLFMLEFLAILIEVASIFFGNVMASPG